MPSVSSRRHPLTAFGSRAEAFLGPPGILLVALLAAALPGPVVSAQSADQSTSSGTYGSQDRADPELPWYARDKFDLVRFANGFTTHILISKDGPRPPTFVFFPPVPPPLESDIPVLEPMAPGPAAPSELSPFVGEIFYPFLGARLAAGDLSKAMRARIVSYRDSKDRLQGEVRSRILASKELSRAEQGRQLADLASLQAPRIAELESQAEKIRLDLLPTNVFGVRLDGPVTGENARWRLRPAGETPTDPAELLKESAAIMDAAFYQDGLSRAQRGLLFEEAIGLQLEARPTTAQPVPGSRLLSFSPETARIRIPSALPAPLENRISDYISAKNRLKAELREALRFSEDAGGDARTASMARLAVAQAARIAEIQAMAEGIRGGLAALPDPPGPPVPPPLPPELTSRISAYRMHKVALLRTLRAMLSSPTPAAGEDPDSRKPKTDEPGSGALAWLHDGSSRTEIQPTNLRVSIAEFDRRQNELISELNKEEAGIREGLAEYVRASNRPSDRKSINDLLRDFEDARQRQEIWDRYSDYQTAVLMPGLSAGQRQMIFDAGIEELQLPLPNGEKAN